MIVLYTTERDYPWGTLRSTHASKTKVVLEEKNLLYRIENPRPRRSLEEAARDAREASARQGPLPRRWRAGDFRLDRDRRVPRRALRTAAPDALRSGAPNACARA